MNSIWLNPQQITDEAIRAYRKFLRSATPGHVVIDDLFQSDKLGDIRLALQQEQHWQTQKHSYAALYVNDATWQKTPPAKRFVQRDLWLRPEAAQTADGPDNSVSAAGKNAAEFLTFLRSEEFMLLLSRIFRVTLTDKNVAKPEVNTNYFRLGAKDFVNQHADDSPGREVCMLLYLNKNWQPQLGGELVFQGQNNQQVVIAPLYNRCVLFDPSSEGAEHWVKAVTADANGNSDETSQYRYNITSWYWSE